MIQSLFETEDAPEDSEKIGTDKVERAEPETTADQTPPAENKETQPVLFEESEIARERGIHEEVVSVEPDVIPEQIIKELETDDDFLELEKAVTKIEEDLGAEKQTEQTAANTGEPEDTGIKSPEKTVENPPASRSEESVETPVIQTPVGEALKKQVDSAPPAVPEPPAAIMARELEAPAALPVQTVSPAEVQSATAPAAEETLLSSEASANKEFKPQSKATIIRQSGLAWSAAIALFGSIVFLMILGWFADLLIGSTPWGIVIGIIIGSILGFYQFFKLTSEILKNHE